MLKKTTATDGFSIKFSSRKINATFIGDGVEKKKYPNAMNNA